MKKPIFTVRDMAYCAIGAALLAVCAWISIPVLEIAFTLQTFGVFLILGTLGGRRGTISILVYLLLGAVGLPVFSGFRGTEALVGVTGGYIVGFLASGLVYWLITALCRDKVWARILAMVVGLLVCYAFGSLWFYILYLRGGKVIPLWAVLLTCVLPYLIPDAVKLALAFLLSARLKKIVDKSAK